MEPDPQENSLAFHIGGRQREGRGCERKAEETHPFRAQSQHDRHPLGGGSEQQRTEIAQSQQEQAELLRGIPQHAEVEAQERHGRAGRGEGGRQGGFAQEVVGSESTNGTLSFRRVWAN